MSSFSGPYGRKDLLPARPFGAAPSGGELPCCPSGGHDGVEGFASASEEALAEVLELGRSSSGMVSPRCDQYALASLNSGSHVVKSNEVMETAGV